VDPQRAASATVRAAAASALSVIGPPPGQALEPDVGLEGLAQRFV
jgi:hypothetical protein